MQTVKWNMVDNDVVRSLPLLAAMGQFRVTDLSPKSEDLQYLSFIWVLWIACISDEDEWNGAAGSESYYEAMVEPITTRLSEIEALKQETSAAAVREERQVMGAVLELITSSRRQQAAP